MFEECANLIKNSHNTVVLTGAGMSTESGIPDFRSDKGIYKQIPEVVLSYSYFLNNPGDFYEFIKDYFSKSNVEPNIGHNILSQWEKEGLISYIITQNIDSLHQRAGSNNVLEVHGTMETATCINSSCGMKYKTSDILKTMNYYCTDCRQLIKPDVVLYDEPVDKINQAVKIVYRADLLMILGSSLMVYPVAQLPQFVPEGGRIIIINNTSTQYDNNSNVLAIHKPIGESLEEINKLLHI